MSDGNSQQQANMIGGEIMEVMMTGGDIGEMNEETVAQVVNMLQSEGQLSGGNNTIIIRQPGSDEIQMIQMTNNGGELIVSKASEADIQALQAGNGVVDCGSDGILSNQQGQVMMMDEGGNLVEGVVQMPSEVNSEQSGIEHPQGDSQATLKQGKDVNVLDNLVNDTAGVTGSLSSVNPTKPITINTGIKPKSSSAFSTGLNGEVVSIKINTGLSFRRREKPHSSPQNVIRISTVTGQQKHNPPKFHKCEACAINFVSKVAYMIHMENCPSKRRALSSVNNKSGVTFTCVFCDTKFMSRLVLMQHVRTCDKAKSSKNVSGSSKLKVTTIESRLKAKDALDRDLIDDKKSRKAVRSRFKDGRSRDFGKGSILDPDDEPSRDPREDSDDEDDNAIEYDDEDDLEDERGLTDEENIEEATATKRSQKHLGPILVKGMFKCRDCSRTFSKEHQYNRHVKACTNAPLNASRIDADYTHSKSELGEDEHSFPIIQQKRKRGRPPLRDYANQDGVSPSKRQAFGPKIVSVNQKSLDISRGRLDSSDVESDEDSSWNNLGDSRSSQVAQKSGPKSKLSLGGIQSSTSSSTVSKVVKINPSDSLIKQTSKALMNKMNKEKFAKLFKETPFCGLCGDKFKKNEELILHTQICHSEDLLQLRDSLDGKGCLSTQKCPLCDLYFVSPHILLLHMVSTHERDLKSAQEALENQNLHLVCPFCFEFSLTQDLLKEHLATRHLEKLADRPTSAVSPIALEFGVPLNTKEEDHVRQSTLKLGGEKSRVHCPECGLLFFKSYFEHHRCAADNFAPSSRRFLCSEPQCASLSFYKLIHLLTHLHQAHGKMLPLETQSFESSTQFLDWLKTEESRTKTKFTKALQRMKSGKLNAVWICHRFCNTTKDAVFNGPNAASRSNDRLNRCYSRIHTEIAFNPSTSRYDGQTVISYFSKHHHPSSSTASSQVQQAEKKKIFSSNTINEAPISSSLSTNEELPVATATLSTAPINDAGAFSDAAELRHLLEGDEESESTPLSSTEPPLGDELDAALESGVVQSSANQLSHTSSSVLPSGSSESQVQGDNIGSTEVGNSKSMGEVPPLEPLSDADLLLEKMLGETDDVATSSTLEGDQTSVGATAATPDAGDESGATYMLPADAAEWQKLFELASSQAGSDEAASLLDLQADIMALPVERQIEVFNKLCSFANV